MHYIIELVEIDSAAQYEAQFAYERIYYRA